MNVQWESFHFFKNKVLELEGNWCHMNSFVLAMLLGLGIFPFFFYCMVGEKALGFNQKYFEDERSSYGLGTTRGWVIHDII